MRFYNFATQREELITDSRILGFGFDEESMAETVAMILRGPDVTINRYKLAKLHWHTNTVSAMLIKLMHATRTPQLQLTGEQQHALGTEFVLYVNVDTEKNTAIFSLINKQTRREMTYGSENSG